MLFLTSDFGFNGANSSTEVLDLGNASGFTGNLQNNIGAHPTNGIGKNIQFTSLGDGVGSLMTFGGGDGDGGQGTRYRLYGNAGPLTMTNRVVSIIPKPGGGNSTNQATLQNDNSSAVNNWIIIPNLLNTNDKTHIFNLRGTNTGNNEFRGNIINSTNGGHALSLSKLDAGKWILTGTNTYTGATTISGGTLQIGGTGRLSSGSYAGAISNAGALQYSSSADQIFSGVISGAGSLTKGTGSSSILTLSTSTNTYTGATNVHAGTLRFAGSSSGTLGAITVGGTSTPVLDIQAGSYTQGAGGFFVGGGAGGAGIVNQTGGAVTWNNNGLQLLIGNGGHAGTYNLSGGSLTTLTGTPSRGVMIGTNSDSTNTFNLSSTGALTVAGTSRLMIGRSDATQINTTNHFSQTGGTATISDMTMGGTSGGAGSGNSATLSLTGGTFTAAAFSLLSAANNDVSTITIGGTAVVTLPNLPTARGSSATATMNFDGGTLRNSATGTFITDLTNAFIMDDGARFDTSLNSTTISQNLLTHGSSTGGGLTKIGANTLTLTGTNTFTGNTTIDGGTLKLDVAGSIANSANITVGSGATFDVSTLTTALTLGAGQSLKSSATGANPTATVTTVAGNDLTLSAGGLTFTAYDGTNGNSATNAPLTVAGASAGELKLNGAPVTVTTTTSLAAGTYVLVAKGGSALLTGTPGTLTVNGSGTAGTNSLSVVGDQLVLTVSAGGDMTPPTLTSIVDNVSGGPVDIGATVTYTVTFNEDIDAASVTSADFNNNGTAGITVGAISETSAGVFTVAVTANSAGSLKLRIPTGAVIEDVALNDLVVPVEDDTTITVHTLFDTWANATYVPPLTMKLAGDDQDGDTFINLMEFAFGTQPTVSSAGSIVWVNGGAVTTPGQPVAINMANPGVDYRAVFGRRKDYAAAGLTYTVEFSAGLNVWVPSAVTPTVLTGAGGLNPSEIEAVSVPYPLLIDLGGNNFKKPTFFRLTISN
jgi:autotransporter-associated beta strand protein